MRAGTILPTPAHRQHRSEGWCDNRAVRPESQFGSLRRGSVERLEWENDRGIKVYGDLVLPTGWNPSAGRLPLVIVQYVTRGFLRGGTGDEFPIFPFAARGFAVLSLQRPAYVADLSGANTHAERVKLNYEGWADRKSVMSAYATGIQMLVDRGIVDPKRVGITGLSDGTVSAAFALLNSKLFAAASLTACCEDPKTQLLMMGNLGAEDLRNFRYPAYTDDAPAFWDPYSIARNAVRFNTPLLSQTADDEYLGSVEAYASLREYGKPMELIVFPDEHHVKWQPAHRISVYRRNLAWFEFWLQGDGAADALPSEMARWREMRSKLTDPQNQVPRR
ncbi:Atxe2 family lasso peptide isopeptidase [Sphingomonas sp. MMS12-HWE2-04]|uniref:Atxe2 family lasso peptide isopeptidase n=1 Tax=Sphingomonas sp. MMS12-HWE2-04 TaxID=3234199 RepID=UPI00384E1D2F